MGARAASRISATAARSTKGATATSRCVGRAVTWTTPHAPSPGSASADA